MFQPVNVETYKIGLDPLVIIIPIGLIFIAIIFIIVIAITNKSSHKEKEKQKMYCKNCGKEIDENSKFCMHCGTQINDSTIKQQKTNDSADNTTEKEQKSIEETENKKNIKIVIGIVIGICIILGIMFGCYKCINTINGNTSKTSIVSRSAKVSDITVQQDTSLAFSYNLIVTPKYDISDLEITFKFYGDNGALIATKIKQIGNVKKNERYNVSFSLSEFSIASIGSISKYSWSVSGGKVRI